MAKQKVVKASQKMAQIDWGAGSALHVTEPFTFEGREFKLDRVSTLKIKEISKSITNNKTLLYQFISDVGIVNTILEQSKKQESHENNSLDNQITKLTTDLIVSLLENSSEFLNLTVSIILCEQDGEFLHITQEDFDNAPAGFAFLIVQKIAEHPDLGILAKNFQSLLSKLSGQETKKAKEITNKEITNKVVKKTTETS